MVFVKNPNFIEIVTGQACTLDAHASWSDKNQSTGATAEDCDSLAITTATTTALFSTPTSGLVRKLKWLSLCNKHATTSVDVTVQIDEGGTNMVLAKTTLAAGQTLQYIEGVGFFVFEPLAQYQKSRQIVTATGTYTTPAGIRAIMVTCYGAGGGGGGVANAATNSGAAGGGGAGACSQTLVQAPSATYSVTIGAAGTAASAGANTGGTGGDTIFGSVCTAKGGLGGVGDTIATIHLGGLGGAGGAPGSGVGDLKGEGQSGGSGFALAAAVALSGTGGSTDVSAGAIEKRNATSAGGSPAAAGGGGGSGGCAISGGASQAGGAGALGLIIVDEFA